MRTMYYRGSTTSDTPLSRRLNVNTIRSGWRCELTKVTIYKSRIFTFTLCCNCVDKSKRSVTKTPPLCHSEGKHWCL